MVFSLGSGDVAEVLGFDVEDSFSLDLDLAASSSGDFDSLRDSFDSCEGVVLVRLAGWELVCGIVRFLLIVHGFDVLGVESEALVGLRVE